MLHVDKHNVKEVTVLANQYINSLNKQKKELYERNQLVENAEKSSWCNLDEIEVLVQKLKAELEEFIANQVNLHSM